MSAIDLIGAVGAARLRRDLEQTHVPNEVADDGVARYMLHKLNGPQVAAICRAVLADSVLAPRVTLRVPRTLVASEGLSEVAITDENAAFARNAPCETPILVLANTVDDLGDTLRDIERVGAPELKGNPALWVDAARRGLPLPESDDSVWASALTGLLNVEDVSLDQFAQYVDATRESIDSAGLPLIDALGWALPVLRMPRDSGRFRGLKPADQSQASKWRKLYQQIISRQRPLLRKQTGGRAGLDREALHEQFGRVRDQISVGAHRAIEEFVEAPPGWTAASEALAEFEWERDGIQHLFEDLKSTPENLGTQTAQFFEFHRPDALTPTDREYLVGLARRRTYKDPREEDTEFYERFRIDLNTDRPLRAKWDRFIFGKGVEHQDFLIGLLFATQRLYEQAEDFTGPKSLTISTQHRTKGQWLTVNADVLASFGARYRGIVELTQPHVTWETHWLFKANELFASIANSRRYRKSSSTARAAVQIKFDLELQIGRGAASRRVGTQLVWQGRPGAIGAELHEDLGRIAERPFAAMTIQQRSVSRKGKLQYVALNDTGSLEPAFDRDAGSLVATGSRAQDLAGPWHKALAKAQREGRLTAVNALAIQSAWDRFAESYQSALRAWKSDGLWGAAPLAQAEDFGDLLEVLVVNARGDLNRRELWEPVLRLGIADVEGGASTAIIAPWHPLRLAGSVIKMRSLAGLLAHILTAEDVNFGDTRLFFADLAEEFAHPYYPEVVVGRRSGSPTLLTVSETLNEYSLAEAPTIDARDSHSNATNEDPANSAKQIGGLVARYLELQPHEHANLSVALYNCDSTGLPLATVSTMSDFSDDDEVRCNIILRHHNTVKLGQLYGQMLESVDADPDALVASESSRDFMAKLRIGIMLDPSEANGGVGGKAVDLAFLQDVVSRRAQLQWIVFPKNGTESLRLHVPPRWAYKRSAAEDELKSTAYLVCPRQPAVGWAYLAAVFGVVTHSDPAIGTRALPVRQIVFQDPEIHSLFTEVHGLAEWVVNYDDLLDKRQLRSQGVSVIRYQRQRSQGRNLVVSSTSPLRLLKVLVKRRLHELNLPLGEDRVAALADRLMEEAADLSGDIVLRAAKRGVFAGELIGIVLSKAIAQEEFGSEAAVGWFFLDDYAVWLGQREGRIADLMGLSPVDRGGRTVLRVIVTEAKYVGADSLAEERRTSQQQLYETVERIQDALFGAPGRLDRDLWLARLSDLLLDSGNAMAADALRFEQLRDRVRRGTLKIELRGYSHVFVHGPPDSGIRGEQLSVAGLPTGLQEVFDRESVRALLLAYESRQPLTPVRGALGDERPWEISTPRQPTAPIAWQAQDGLGVEVVDDDLPPGGSAVNRAGPDDGLLPSGQSTSSIRLDQSVQDSRGIESSSAPADTLRNGNLPIIGTELDEPPTETQSLSSLSAQGIDHSVGSQKSRTNLIYCDAFARVIDRLADAAPPSTTNEDWLADIERRLKAALLGYRISARSLGTRLTPNAALVRFQGSDTMNVEQVDRRRGELLTTHGLRIITVTGRPGEIVVAVAREQREVVPLWDVLRRREINRDRGGINTSFVLGVRELDGELLYLNLGTPFSGQEQHAPHTLIAGATGSGKSVLLQNLLLDICATNSPVQANIYLIDPKFGVDYPALRALPHLRGGIITEREAAREAFVALIAEMERRYRQFAQLSVNTLERYNATVSEAERLPAIWLVHDEFAEWMMVEEYKVAVSETVARLGVMARAAGIYLVFAAQRPDRDVFPMQLRENLGNRLVLRVQGAGTSEIALGVKGAELLLGKGHLAARLSGESDIIYAQVPFLSGEDLASAAGALVADTPA
jgi:DNA segregation ATPase FtsK/SpoIIIE, S-DNA-T family